MSEQEGRDPLPFAGKASDPHAQAAYLLVESLLHELVSKSVICIDDAVQVVSVAADVGEALDERGQTGTRPTAHALLRSLLASLELER